MPALFIFGEELNSEILCCNCREWCSVPKDYKLKDIL